jgi:hypothetical protein
MNRQYLLKKIGSPPPPEKMVTPDQDAYDIINRILLKHKNCACDYDKIAQDFEGPDTYTIAQKLWNFCKKNIAYDEESIERQNVSSPQTILQRGHCDCKGYALFIGGVLDALNRLGYSIKWKYRFASDDLLNDIPGHVFVVITDQGHEIWVDPVLSEFNQDHYFPYYEDRKVTAPAKVAGCGCQVAIGATTQQVGAGLMKVAPALSAVPVAALAVEVVGLALNFFGSKYTTSNDVRWLTAKYQFYVLGDGSAVSNHHANETYTQPAAKWFSYVVGVPVFDQLRYHALRGTSPDTGKSLNLTRQQRAQNYLNSAPDAVQQGYTLQDAINATYPADQFKENGIDGNYPPGSWKNFPIAPSLVEQDPAAQPTMYVDQYGNLTTPAGAPVVSSHNNLILLAAGAAILFLLLK